MQQALRNPRFFERAARILIFVILPIVVILTVGHAAMSWWDAIARAQDLAFEGNVSIPWRSLLFTGFWNGTIMVDGIATVFLAGLGCEAYAQYLRSRGKDEG